MSNSISKFEKIQEIVKKDTYGELTEDLLVDFLLSKNINKLNRVASKKFDNFLVAQTSFDQYQ